MSRGGGGWMDGQGVGGREGDLAEAQKADLCFSPTLIAGLIFKSNSSEADK